MPATSHRSQARWTFSRLKRGLRAPLLVAALLATGSCVFSPFGTFTVAGRLENSLGCFHLLSGGRSYELLFGRVPAPPAGAFVALRVKPIQGASACMVGQMVEVLRVMNVVTDFRTAPVAGAETWTPDQAPIVLGRVEVLRGATLTILPGTTVRIIREGELRARGTLKLVGTPGDSVRVSGGSPDGGGAGPVVLDSAQAGTQVGYAVIPSLVLRGAAPSIEHVSVAAVSVEGGSAALRDSRIGGLSAYGANVTLEAADLAVADGIFADFTIVGSTLSGLTLSYSRATVRNCRFAGRRSFVIFHGPAEGTFERNAFIASETTIEVRHTSTPGFHENDFLSPSTRVFCETYQLPTCVGMERNWWGTADESEIRARLDPACPVCYVPWLTGPVTGPRP